MNKIKEIIKDKWFWLSSVICVLVLCFAFATQKIYPFGKNTFSMIDFDSGYVPVYYKLWDLLHGKGSIFVDWNLGSGLNVFSSIITNSPFFPSSLIIGLFKRNFIPYAMSFVMMLKFVKVALCAYFMFNYFFKKLDGKTKCSLTLLYAFSGWTLFNQSNLLYLDVFGIFPLFVIAFYRLLKDGKWGWYLIMLTLCLLSSYYMSYLILFFIIGTTILSLLLLNLKDKKTKAIKVFLLTLLSLGLSCPLVLPAVYQSLTSARMTGGITNNYDQFVFFLKVLHIYPLALCMIVFFKQIKVKKDKIYNRFFILLVIYLLLGIVIEKINLLWHVGSYQGFPFRYAFIPSLILLLITGFYLNNNYEYNENKTSKTNTLTIVLYIIFIISAMLYRKDILSIVYVYSLQEYSQFVAMTSLLIISLAVSYFLFKTNKKFFAIFILIWTCTSSLTYESLFMRSYPSKSLHVQELKDNLNLTDKNYNYVDSDANLNINFPYIVEVPSYQNRIHILNNDAFVMLKNFDLITKNTLIYNSGGNLIIDLLLQNKYFLSYKHLNPELYTLKNSYQQTNLYEANYNLNVILYDGNSYNDKNDVITNTNNIAKAVFNSEQDIMHNVEIHDNEFTALPNRLYYIDCDLDIENDTIKFGLNTTSNVVYFYGTYSKCKVIFYVEEEKVIDLSQSSFNNVSLGYIDINDFIALYNTIDNPQTIITTSSNTISYDFTNTNHSHLLIPKFYDDGFKAYVNGKEVPIEKNIYDLMSIKIDQGHNTVKLVFIPKMLKEGLTTCIACIIALLVSLLLNKYLHLLERKIIVYPLFGIVLLIGAFFIIKVYILSWLL